jgi:alanine dehydrogenase
MTRLRVLGAADVRELLDLDALVDALAAAMADLSAGRVSMPPRIAAAVEERDGLLLAMPAHVPSAAALSTKLVSLWPRNAGTGVPTHQAVVLGFDPETGTPAALLDGTEITAWRTAAGSALSARLLAREDADVLTVIGTGVQGRAHALTMPRVRPVREVRIAGRDAGKARALAADVAAELDVPVVGAGSVEEALDGARLVCACTHPSGAVFRREWLAPGAHVTSVGYDPVKRELDDATVADALVVVESRASALAPPPSGSPDLLEPIRDGVIDAGHVHAEVGELVTGDRPGRTGDDQLTLYKSVGVAVQDAVAAALVLARAEELGRGREVDL